MPSGWAPRVSPLENSVTATPDAAAPPANTASASAPTIAPLDSTSARRHRRRKTALKRHFDTPTPRIAHMPHDDSTRRPARVKNSDPSGQARRYRLTPEPRQALRERRARIGKAIADRFRDTICGLTIWAKQRESSHSRILAL
jgi:hypothetical protein